MNHQNIAIDNTPQKERLTNLSGLGLTKENAANLAGFNGAIRTESTENSRNKHTPKRGVAAISKYYKDRHKRAARMLGYCLTLNTPDVWLGAADFLRKRLTMPELVGLAYSILEALPRDIALEAAQARLGGAGQPIAPLFSFMDQAAFWADMAEPEEAEAYCLASFNRMAPGRKVAFLSHVQREMAA